MRIFPTQVTESMSDFLFFLNPMLFPTQSKHFSRLWGRQMFEAACLV